MVCAGYVLIFCLACSVGVPVEFTRRSGPIGNFARNIAGLQATANPNDFTFCVMGDIKGGTATFEELLDTARADNPAFAVVLGDFVCHSEPAAHKLFISEVAEERLSFPLFLVPGNHDINADDFSIAEFEQLHGPAQFHFALGKYLFVFLNNVSSDNGYLPYLKNVIAQEAAKTPEVFVFMHIPPDGLNPEIHSRGLPGSEEFMQLVRQYGVRYVFAGDHHGYVKTVKGSTTYMVTGGGGAKLRGEHGKFHHMVRMAIKDGTITETVISTEKKAETLELMERNLGVYVWPFLTRSIGHISAGMLMFIMSAIYLGFALRRVKRHNHSTLHATLTEAC